MRFSSRCRAGVMGSCWAPAALLWMALVGASPVPAAELPAVRVMDAWIRWLPAGLPAAGYATLVNVGDRPVTLIGASSPDYGDVSLHQSRNQGGTEEMVPVERITVAAHSSLSFAAMGYHMMLMQPVRPLKPGDRAPITLRFAGASPLTIEFDVRKPGSSAAE